MFTRRTVTTAGLCLVAMFQKPPRAWSADPATPAALTPERLFEFHSSFWLNLHLFLYNVARAQGGLDSRPTVKRALADREGFDALSPAAQQAWQAAVAYYLTGPAKRDLLFDRDMVALGNQLALLDPGSTPGEGVEAGLAGVLQPAAEVYRRLWWPRHDALNQTWLTSMRPLIAAYGPDIAAYETRAFGVSWPQKPIRVDVTAYANWAGGYTSERPSHTVIPSSDPGDQADQGLEILFHEALHTMDGRLLRVLSEAFKASGKPLPNDATHVFIFHTAGVATQRAVARHAPYAEVNGLWDRVADFRKAKPLLEAHWRPHLDGKVSLEDAAQAYARAY